MSKKHNTGRALLGGALARAVQPYVEHEQAVISLCTVLSGNPHYDGVEAAVRNSGMTPDELYQVAIEGKPLPETFCEALYGPDYGKKG